MSQFFIGVVTSIVGAIIWYFLQRLFSKGMGRRRTVLVGVYLAGLILAALAPLFFTLYSWYRQLSFSAGQHLTLIVCSAAIQVGFGIPLYRLIRRGLAPVKQFDEKPVRVQTEDRRTISVRRIFPCNLGDPYDPTHISWSTFHDGVEFLLGQIRKYPHALPVDLYVGINDVGTIVASIIAGTRGGEHVESVEFISAKDDRFRFESGLLSGAHGGAFQPRNILIVDFKVKSGRAIEDVSEFLRNKYGDDIKIKFAALVAPLVSLTPDGDPVDMMRVVKCNKWYRDHPTEVPGYLPDFLAFMSYNDLRLPHGMR